MRHHARGRVRLAVAALAAMALCASTVPSAVADKGQHHGDQGAFPSQSQVDAAKQRAAQKASDVGAIKASLLMAKQRLDRADLRAEQASEAYNGARWRLEQAKVKARQARAEAAKARRTVSEQRDAIGALVATSYQQGAELSSLSAMMGADGPQGVLDQYAAFQGASTSLQADYKRFAASDALAKVFALKAEQAQAEQVRLTARARQARQDAVAAEAQARAAASQIAAEKNKLIHQLAKAQNISVDLARQRQSALEEIARKRAEARARAVAEAAARAQARADAAAAAKARAVAAATARANAKARRAAARAANANDNGSQSNPNPNPPPAPNPPPPAPDPSPSGGVNKAIAFAEAQLGEPYRWGAAGPSSWDCSGLMLGAFGAAGIYLPHYSGAQYDAGTPIPVSSARRGDLLFWSSNGAPSGIHHVALYLGGGDFIEAPHTGANVRYNSIYSWYPNFAVRL